MYIQEKVSHVLLTWLIPMHGTKFHINGPLLLEDFANLRTHLIATLSGHQMGRLQDGKRVTCRLPVYTFFHLKADNKEGGLYSNKYCH